MERQPSCPQLQHRASSVAFGISSKWFLIWFLQQPLSESQINRFSTSSCWALPLVSGNRQHNVRRSYYHHRSLDPILHTTADTSMSMDAAASNDVNSAARNSATFKIRGEGLYGIEHNSTILSADQAAAAVGVQPLAKVPPLVWKYAIRLHAALIPLLHWRDPYRPPDSQKSLLCLWWKALIALDLSSTTTSWRSSPIPNDNQHQLAYQLLPRSSRWILKVAHRLFPRLHHANVEIRTVFLNRAIGRIVEEQRQQQDQQKNGGNKRHKMRLIYLGAGYDVRSIYLQQHGLVDKAVELDLPHVLDAKQKLFTSPRFRDYCTPQQLPTFVPVDLNDLDQVRQILHDILAHDDAGDWYNIILFEGVMIYLQPGIPHGLLQVCSDALRNTNGGLQGMLCFADRLENIPSGDEELARLEMEATGWELVEWLPKPGLARHMGVARLLQTKASAKV